MKKATAPEPWLVRLYVEDSGYLAAAAALEAIGYRAVSLVHLRCNAKGRMRARLTWKHPSGAVTRAILILPPLLDAPPRLDEPPA